MQKANVKIGIVSVGVEKEVHVHLNGDWLRFKFDPADLNFDMQAFLKKLGMTVGALLEIHLNKK